MKNENKLKEKDFEYFFQKQKILYNIELLE